MSWGRFKSVSNQPKAENDFERLSDFISVGAGVNALPTIDEENEDADEESSETEPENDPEDEDSSEGGTNPDEDEIYDDELDESEDPDWD